MDIKNAIVHKIEKKRHHPSIIIEKPTDETLEINDNLLELVSSLTKLYGSKTGRGYGEFIDNIDGYPLQTRLSEYLGGNISFLAFTKRAMKILKSKIDDARLATGGYLLFVEYLNEESHSFIIASIKDKKGLAFDNNLNLNGQMHLDLDKLHEMAKIDITSWSSGDEKYLSFAKSRTSSSDHSEYFQSFIGCHELANARSMNELLVAAVREYGITNDLTPEEQKNLRGIVLSYCQEKEAANEQIDLVMLSQRINEESPEKFISFINENEEEYPISNHFDPIKSVYKKFQFFKTRKGDVQVQFGLDSLGKNVNLNSQDNLVISDLDVQFIAELKEMM